MKMAKRAKIDVANELRKQWFVFSMLFCVLLAVLNPYYGSKEGKMFLTCAHLRSPLIFFDLSSVSGPLQTEYTIQYGCIGLIYFTAGLKQTLNDLQQCLQIKKLFIFVQVNCFLIIPMLVKAMTDLLENLNANTWVLKGLLTLSSSPPPLWSAIAMLRLSRSQEAPAVLNTLLANFTGAIFTPIIMIYLCGSTVMASPYKTMTHITLAAIIPLSLGMFINNKYSNINFRKLHSISEMVPLAILYSSICDCIYETQHMIHDGIYAISGVIQVQLFVVLSFALSWFLAKSFLPDKLVYTAVFCSSHKDMVLDVHEMSLLWGWSGAVRCAVTCRAGLPTALLPASLLAGYNRVESPDDSLIDLG